MTDAPDATRCTAKLGELRCSLEHDHEYGCVFRVRMEKRPTWRGELVTINRENFATWTAALRSGEYKQGVGMLKQRRRDGSDEILHCCLGVACELAGLPSEPSAPGASDFTFRDRDRRELAVLPHSAREWLGVSDDHGITFSPDEALPAMNDAGITFEVLADRIDAWVAEQS